jgi:FMN-dependent dehydrogenase
MQIWIKGVLEAEHTQLAIKHGCGGIIVSKHGGRQLDGVPATIDALVECVGAARGRNPDPRRRRDRADRTVKCAFQTVSLKSKLLDSAYKFRIRIFASLLIIGPADRPFLSLEMIILALLHWLVRVAKDRIV